MMFARKFCLHLSQKKNVIVLHVVLTARFKRKNILAKINTKGFMDSQLKRIIKGHLYILENRNQVTLDGKKR